MEDSEIENRIEGSKFRNNLLDLRKTILDGISYFIVWQALNIEYEDSIQNLRSPKDFWWRYRGFFAPARNALLWSTLMQLSKAFDKHPGTASFDNLLTRARNNIKELTPYATQDSLEDIQVKIHKNFELLKRLREYRNKKLAHLDSEFNGNIALTLKDVSTLIEETKSIFNSLKYSCDGEYDNFIEIMEDVSLHTSQVISIMNKIDNHN